MNNYAKLALSTVALLLLIFLGVVVYRLANPENTIPQSAPVTQATATPVEESQIDCSPEILSPYLTAQDEITERWDDAVRLAHATSRIALSPAIASLQSLRREASALTPPECAAYLQELQLLYMDYAIDGFLLFMQKVEGMVLEKRFELYDMARETYDTYLSDLRSDPLPTYTELQQPQTIVDHFESDPAWQTIHIEEGNPITFSIPPGWTNPPSDDSKIIRITNQDGDIEIKVFRDDLDKSLSTASPQALMFYAEDKLLLDGMRPAVFTKLGENVGPLYRLGVSDGSLTELSGALALPDNSKLIFDANKPVTPFTEEEVGQIYTVLASFRVASSTVPDN